MHTTNIDISLDWTKKLKPIPHFNEYLNFGYYPFFLEHQNIYHRRLNQIINLVIESDLAFIQEIRPKQTRKIHQLLFIIASLLSNLLWLSWLLLKLLSLAL